MPQPVLIRIAGLAIFFLVLALLSWRRDQR